MISIKRLAGGVALSALACAMSTAVYAQETTASIRGDVTGSGGAPVAGATITAVHIPSGTRSTTVSGAEGVFDLRGLRVGGPYTVTVTAPGEQSKALDGVFLTLGETERLNFSLAAEVEELVVTAALDPTAENTGARTTLDAQDVQSVVSVTRDIRDLARRSPLVSQNARGDGGISIAGSNPRNNRITIDGAQAQDDYGLNTGGTPIRRGPISLDAIEQFTVDAVPIDVENGDFSGGALDIVLKSGGNDFSGSLFTNYLNDGMVGRKIRGVDVPTQISQTNYGAFLSGPIWRDRLFFAASYEKYESSDVTATGPTGAGFANSINGVTQATIDELSGIFNNRYATEFDLGGIPLTAPVIDEKYSLKLDANITDQHRATFTYRYGLSEVIQRNVSTNTASLSSNWYLQGEEDYSYAAELNSQWTDRLSTQLRVTYRDYERRQNPPSGQEFAEISVCLVPTTVTTASVLGTANSCDRPGSSAPSQFRFGPDLSRQANELETHNFQVQFKAEYTLGDHLLKFGVHTQENEIANLFIQRQDGVYYFDTIAAFQRGEASQLTYNDAVGGLSTRDATAALKYRVNSVFAQDTLDVTPDLQITAGFRYDWYQNDEAPPLNPNFLARNGVDNQTTFEGRSVMMPRVAFDWRATDSLRVRGGAGIFSGGVPDVLQTNIYGGGVGTLTSGIDIRRNADNTFSEFTGTSGFTQAIGASALNINLADARAFYDIPASVRAFQGGAVASPLNEVTAFSPGFQFPSDYKLFLSATYDVPSFFGDADWANGWRLGFDFVGSKVRDSLYLQDLRARPLIINGQVARLPDGRIRYDNVNATAAVRAANGVSSTAAVGGTNRDLVYFNTDKGYSVTAAVSLSKTFDFGLDVTGSYTWQDAKDFGSALRFASTSGSTYQSPAGEDPNLPAYGTSYDEIEHSLKFEASYARKFFGDNETRLTLFAESRSGRSTSFVMQDNTSGRGPVFGVNRGFNHLLYVPNLSAGGTGTGGLTYGNVVFADAATRDNFLRLVDRFDLPEGQIVEKGFYQNDWIHQVDLQLSQQLPTPISGHKFRLVVDLQNVLNLLNDEWGIIEEYRDVNGVVNVTCDDATTANPFACSRYRYSNFQSSALNETIDTNGRSTWRVQVGLRYEF